MFHRRSTQYLHSKFSVLHQRGEYVAKGSIVRFTTVGDDDDDGFENNDIDKNLQVIFSLIRSKDWQFYSCQRPLGFHLEHQSTTSLSLYKRIHFSRWPNLEAVITSAVLQRFRKHKRNAYYNVCNCLHKRLRWSRGSVLAFGTQVRGFVPGRSRRKNPQHPFLRRGSKAVGPMS